MNESRHESGSECGNETVGEPESRSEYGNGTASESECGNGTASGPGNGTESQNVRGIENGTESQDVRGIESGIGTGNVSASVIQSASVSGGAHSKLEVLRSEEEADSVRLLQPLGLRVGLWPYSLRSWEHSTTIHYIINMNTYQCWSRSWNSTGLKLQVPCCHSRRP